MAEAGSYARKAVLRITGVIVYGIFGLVVGMIIGGFLALIYEYAWEHLHFDIGLSVAATESYIWLFTSVAGAVVFILKVVFKDTEKIFNSKING